MVVILLLTLVIYWVFVRRLRPWVLRWLIFIPIMLTASFLNLFFDTQAAFQAELEARQLLLDSVLDTYAVSRGDLIITVNATGTIAPARQTPLLFQAGAAPVSEILAETGDTVAEGDVIARIDNTDLERTLADATIALDLQRSAYDTLISPPRPEDIASAEAALNAARAQWSATYLSGTNPTQDEVTRLQAEIARNRLWQAQIQADSATFSGIPLLAPDLSGLPTDVVDDVQSAIDSANGLITDLNWQSQQAFLAQQTQTALGLNALTYGVQAAEANYASSLSRGADPGSLAAANSQILQAQTALDRLLNGATDLELQRANIELTLAELSVALVDYNLVQSELRAPFSGVIAQNNLKVGQLVPQGIAVLLMDTSTLYVDLPVDETDIVKIREGQRVIFNVDALPDAEVSGSVVRVAYTPLVIGQLVTYTVRVRLNPTEAPLRVGMSVTARIVTQERLDVVLIPNRFIRTDRATQDTFVTLRSPDDRFTEVLVLLGERGDNQSEVLSGLNVGESAVLLPLSVLEAQVQLGDGTVAQEQREQFEQSADEE